MSGMLPDELVLISNKLLIETPIEHMYCQYLSSNEQSVVFRMELVAHPSMVLFGQEQSLFQAELKCDCSGSPTMWETQGQKPSKTIFNI